VSAEIEAVDNSNGRRWAHFWLVVALLVSVAANITHTVMADSEISLWLRVPGAMVWPLFTFGGIETMARIIWEQRWTHSIARNALLAAAVPAAITSYEHQFTLLGMMGERPMIQFIGPLAIDGLMIGCTMALLLTRKGAPVAEPAPATPIPATIVPQHPEPVTLPEITEEEFEEIKDSFRRRATKADQERAVRLMLDGKRQEAVDAGIVGESTMRRYEQVQRVLRNDPQATDFRSATGKVAPEHVAIIRDAMNRERAL